MSKHRTIVLTPVTLLLFGISMNQPVVAAESLRVMTYNIWVGGEAGGHPLAQTIRVIQAARPDVVGMQEGFGEERNGKRPNNARAIAAQLGWNYFAQGDDGTSILSPHKIVAHTPKKWGAAIELPSGRRVWVFNVHFSHAPYQPYQLLKIPYHDAPFIDTAEEAVQSARETRNGEVEAMLAEVAAVRGQDAPIFITGDFNEPSALDWTEPVFRAGRCPHVVPWPTTAQVYNAGFLDSYRHIHPNPLTKPGYTWTPTTSPDDPRDRHDRIDFVMVAGPGVRITRSEVVGEKLPEADIVVTPYPSDHRAVVSTVAL